MRNASAEARLSNTVFAAFWSEATSAREPSEMLGRWFPMEVKTPHHTVPIDAAWFSFEVSPNESSRDVFDRVAAEVDGDALPRGWDGQVG